MCVNQVLFYCHKNEENGSFHRESEREKGQLYWGGGGESAESEMSPSFNLQAHRDPQPTVRFCLTASAALQRPGEDVAVQRKRLDLAEGKGCREGMGGVDQPTCSHLTL